jgi:molybdopterin-biosynthesis enzyme MoeA-like protein
MSILEEKFGADAYPHRIRMADLPQGAALIPNPVNRVPGFSLRHHHFVPGFPNMAHPMVEWVLETFYHEWFQEEADIEITLLTEDAPESRLIPILETVLAAHPQVRIASLPNTSQRQQVELGVKGRRAWVEPAAEMLMTVLGSEGIHFSRIQACSE